MTILKIQFFYNILQIIKLLIFLDGLIIILMIFRGMFPTINVKIYEFMALDSLVLR